MSVSTAMVHQVLTESNYEYWSACLKNYLLGQDLWDIVESGLKPSQNKAEFKTREKKNAMALHTIQISCGPDKFLLIKGIDSAKAAWDCLAELHIPQLEGDVSESETSSCLHQDGEAAVGDPGDDNSSEYIQYEILLKAVIFGDWEAAKKFLEDNRDALSEKIAFGGYTALHVAIFRDKIEIAERLVQLMREQDLQIQDDAGLTALHHAVGVGHVEIVEKLVQLMPKKDLGIQYADGCTILHFAVEYGHVEIAEKLVQLMPKKDLGIQDADGCTVLHFAVQYGHVEIAEKLVQLMPKQYLRVQDVDGLTALHFALEFGHVEMAEKLVHLMPEQDLGIQDAGGLTALHFAVQYGHAQIAEKLMQLMPKQDLGIQNESGLTALHFAIVSGHVEIAEKLVQLMEKQHLVIQNVLGSTALHFAVIAEQVTIVEKLVQLMTEQDLEKQTKGGQTALSFAVFKGNFQMAYCMVRKNRNLLRVKVNEQIPVVSACTTQYKNMMYYLYKVTPVEELNGTIQGAKLLNTFIRREMFDIALDLVKRCPLPSPPEFELHPLLVLAGMPSAFPSGSLLGYWKQWMYSCIHIEPTYISVHVQEPRGERRNIDGRNFVIKVCDQLRHPFAKFRNCILRAEEAILGGIKRIHNQKLIHVSALEIQGQLCRAIQEKYPRDRKITKVFFHDALLEATKNGIYEIALEIIKANSAIFFETDMDSRRVIDWAIMYRREKIFNLIYGLDGASMASFINHQDRYNNNILHLAGTLAPPDRLSRISGAALQMQRELQWFKEVESIIDPFDKNAKNSDGKSPYELFTEGHVELVKAGEKWMKEMASSCTVVATLIVTIMFAAAFTVPGGNNQDTGAPIFIDEKLFMAFIISDAISFFSSSASVLMFVVILTSRYSAEYFLESLPRKMIIGLSTLFISIATMTIAFCAVLLLMLREQSVWIFILIIFLASVPIILFLSLLFPLLVEISISTYGSSIFDKKKKPLALSSLKVESIHLKAH